MNNNTTGSKQKRGRGGARGKSRSKSPLTGLSKKMLKQEEVVVADTRADEQMMQICLVQERQ
jgi:hypothetical protein